MTTTNHGSPVPPASVPAATAGTETPQCPECSRRMVPNSDRREWSCRNGHPLVRYIPPTGEEAEKFCDYCGSRKHSLAGCTRIGAASYREEVLTAQATELAALRARVEEDDPETLAQRFHEAYERLAPTFGYETRKASAKPWAEVPDANRRLMIAVCAEVLARTATPPEGDNAE